MSMTCRTKASAIERFEALQDIALAGRNASSTSFADRGSTATMDVSSARLKDIAVAAVTLDEAKRNFGKKTQRYFVFAASAVAERQARGFLHAAEHHAEHTFNFASRADRGHYFDFIYDALRGDLAGNARMIATEKVGRPGRRLAARAKK